MASRRTLCLLEASKLGLILDYDPSGERNRCFYQCLGKHLRVDKVERVIDALENYMLHNRLVPVENEVSRCFSVARKARTFGSHGSHVWLAGSLARTLATLNICFVYIASPLTLHFL